MNKLLRDDGKETTNPNEISQMQKTFYKQLYSNRSTKKITEKQKYLDKIEVSSLNEEDSKKCDGELTAEELLKSIKSFKSGKSPGIDGLTAEFYQKFSGLIIRPLLDALNAGHSTGELSISQKQAVIKLLDKGKDRTLLKNWRPISILNVDYKICTKVIGPNQMGYIEGR
jgi:hypothetical protein